MENGGARWTPPHVSAFPGRRTGKPPAAREERGPERKAATQGGGEGRRLQLGPREESGPSHFKPLARRRGGAEMVAAIPGRRWDRRWHDPREEEGGRVIRRKAMDRPSRVRRGDPREEEGVAASARPQGGGGGVASASGEQARYGCGSPVEGGGAAVCLPRLGGGCEILLAVGHFGGQTANVAPQDAQIGQFAGRKRIQLSHGLHVDAAAGNHQAQAGQFVCDPRHQAGINAAARNGDGHLLGFRFVLRQVRRFVETKMGELLRLHNGPMCQCCHAASAWLS